MKRARWLVVPLVLGLAGPGRAHVLNYTIAASGGCPQPDRFDPAKTIDRRWSTVLNPSVRTSTTDAAARVAEVQQVVTESFAVWTGVAGASLVPAMLAPLATTSVENACIPTDTLNSICFSPTDASFPAGVVAFTRIVTSDIPGETFGSKTSAFVGEILDADILFKPGDPSITFATPAALAANPGSFDLESVLVHELGHFFGLNHSSVWRAMMWPFALPGAVVGERPTPQAPDGPLADDDRVGLRILYPDPNDTVNVGVIRGRVLPANPLALAGLPEPSPGRPVSGVFGTQVVALDADTGRVVAATLGGWTCDPGSLPTRFDGTYVFERLPLGRSYKLYVEPLDGPTTSFNIASALGELCRPGTSNACTVPDVNTSFTTRFRPAP